MIKRLIGIALLSFSITAYGIDVSNPAELQPNELPPQTFEKASLSVGAISIDPSAFSSYGTDVDASRKLLKTGDSSASSLEIGIPAGPDLKLQITRVHELVPGVLTYTGIVDEFNDLQNKFVLSIENGEVTGIIKTGLFGYKIKPAEGKYRHYVETIELSAIPKSDDYRERQPVAPLRYSETSSNFEASSSQMMSSTNNETVRIHFVYSSAVNSNYNVGSLLANIIAELNSSFGDSGIEYNAIFEYAGSDEISSDHTGTCKWDLLTLMNANVTSSFNTLDTDRAAVDADISGGIFTDDASLTPFGCRIGGIGEPYTSQEPNFVVMDDFALSDITASHEIGHVLGMNHETESGQSLNPGTPSNSRGYYEGSLPAQTVMGGYYGGNCNNVYPNNSCDRISLWSSPLNQYQSYTMGSGVANTVDAFDTTMPTVASWESYPDPAPSSAPSNFYVVDERCFGSNSVHWNTVSDATTYQLMRSVSSSFTYPVRIYNGSSTSTFIDVPQGQTWYLRARACNGNGCSLSYSSQDSADYYSGCI